MRRIFGQRVVWFWLAINCWPLLQPNELIALSSASPSPLIDPHGPPPPPPENPPPAPPTPAPTFRRADLEKFVAAYLEAGSASNPAGELKFFAGRVDYRGQPNVSPEEIRRDLMRDRARWPERHYQRAGNLTIEPQPNDRVRVRFPLHFEFRNGRQHHSGDVIKILLLERSGGHDFKIIALDERKSGS